MASLEVLNCDIHRHLRLRRTIPAIPHFVPIVAAEFTAAACCCPIVLCKNPETGRFYAGAMFGLRPGENLVSELPGFADAFRPLDVERQGFYISGENIAVDLDHPRISTNDGDLLFDEDGEPSDGLRRIQRALGLLATGNEATEKFIQRLVELRLIEPVDVSLSFDDGEKLQLNGLYTVTLDGIAELDDAVAIALFRNGYLRLAYTIAGSLQQIRVLASRRNHLLLDRADA